MFSSNVISESRPSEWTLSSQELINATGVADAAIARLQDNPEGQEAMKLTFDKMVSERLRDPASIDAILRWLYAARDRRLEGIEPSKRLSALETFSQFIKWFSQNVAHMHRDIDWSNDLRNLEEGNQKQMEWIKSTYAWIIQDLHPTQTA